MPTLSTTLLLFSLACLALAARLNPDMLLATALNVVDFVVNALVIVASSRMGWMLAGGGRWPQLVTDGLATRLLAVGQR